MHENILYNHYIIIMQMKDCVTNMVFYSYVCTILCLHNLLGTVSVFCCTHVACVTACELLSAAAHADHQNNLGHVNLSHVCKHSDR